MSPRRILVAFHLGRAGGPSISLAPSLAWLAQGWDLELLVPGDGGVGAGAGAGVGASYAALGHVSALDFGAATFGSTTGARARALARLARDTVVFRRHLRASRPAMVIAVTTTLPALLLAARLERIPVLVYAGELFEPGSMGPARAALGAMLIRTTGALAHGVLCCSEAVALQFEGSRAEVAVAYPPIDAAQYGDGDGRAFRARHGLGSARPCLAVIGNLSRTRGADVAIRALESIRLTCPAAQLAIVGEPHPREVDRRFAAELRHLSLDLGLEDAVVFTGFVERMADVYAAADVVINPALVAEAFGRVAVEAQIAGTPVVSSRVGAVPEVLSHGRDALLVAPGQARALADAVLALVRNDALAARLAEGGRLNAQRFGVARSVSTFARLVGSIADGAAHR